MASADNGNSIVGDLPGYGEDAYFGDDAAYQETAHDDMANDETANADDANYVSDVDGDADYQDTFDDGGVAPVGHSIVTRNPATKRVAARTTSSRQAESHPNQVDPISASQLQPASFHHDGHEVMMSSSDCGCGSGGCGDVACGSGCEPSGKICNLFDRCGSNAWGTFETLLWFTGNRNIVPLVTTSDTATLPVLGLAGSNTQVAFGGELESDLQVGFRGDAGFWLSENVGLGGRFWILDEATDDFSLAGDGSGQSIGRPFFNTSNGAVGNDALLVALDGVFEGGVDVESSLQILAAEAYGRLRIGSGQNAQLDFIGGYTYFNIDESLSINDRRFNVSSGTQDAVANNGPSITPLGTLRTFSDNFDIENEFHGGQLGFDLMIHRGRWTAKSLTKVHLGNMSRSFQAVGNNTSLVPGGTQVSEPGGLLAGADPIDFDDDVFTFAPEANFKLAYRFRPNVAFSVGYSFIYFDNVATVGDNVGNLVSGNNIGTGTAGANPAFDGAIRDSGLWVQGVDLGVVIDF